VNTALDFFGNLAELFSWIGLGLGLVFLVLWLIVRSVSGRWIETDAEVVNESGAACLRWMSIDGLHERPISAADRDQLHDADRVRLFYSQHAPERIRFDRIGHGENTLRLLTGLLLGLGAVALVASIVVLFIEV
jgi:hypothetical protein